MTNKQARQHEIAKGFYRQKKHFTLTAKQRTSFQDLWSQPKFENSVGSAKHDSDY